MDHSGGGAAKYDTGKLTLHLLTTILTLGVTATVAIFAILSYAWFSSGRQVDAENMTVSVDGRLFELRVDDKDKLVSPDYLTVLTEKQYADNLTITSGAHVGISCILSTNDGEKIRPGSRGTLEFYIVPAASVEELTIQFLPTLSGIKRNVGDNDVVSYAAVTDESTLQFLKGHILFFQTHTTGGKYSGWIDPDVGFTYSLAAHSGEKQSDENGNYYPVTLYWVWPQTYVHLTNGSAFADNDQAALIARLNSNPEEFLSGVDSAEGRTSLQLNDGYNRADQVIGDHISYLMAEVKASPAS